MVLTPGFNVPCLYLLGAALLDGLSGIIEDWADVFLR